MKPKKPSRGGRQGVPSPHATVDFIVGTVEGVEYHPPLPPGGTRMKYVDGKFVAIGRRESSPKKPAA